MNPSCWMWGALLCAAAGCGRGPLYKFTDPVLRRCEAVDFLFVIDNSDSMQPHQDNLRGSFSPFIASIESSLDDVDDFHVGVVTTDAYRDNEPECRALGALVTQVDQQGPDPNVCGPFAQGERYMTEQDDLAETFSCAAAVGTNGSPEEDPMRALTRAVRGGHWDWFEQCNAGFVRDNALLVAVIITDEAAGEPDLDEEDHTEPARWFDVIVGAKGAETNAVIVSLINGVTPDCPVASSAFNGRNIADFTERFTHGFVGGICQPNYGEIFARAVDGVDLACSGFTATPEP